MRLPRRSKVTDDPGTDPVVSALLGEGGGGASAGGRGAAGGPPPSSRPQVFREGGDYDPTKLREETRSNLALGLLLLLGLVALLLVTLLGTNLLNDAETKDLATGVLSPLVAITGTALGFYFGGHKDGK